MLRRKKKVQPFVDEYILRRYEDIAVLINADLCSEKGLRNHYVPWLEGKLEGFPEPLRKKYSLMRTPAARPALRAWAEEVGPSTHTTESGTTEPRREVGRLRETRWKDNAADLVERRGRDISSTDQQLQPGRGNSERPAGDSSTNSKVCIIL